MKEPHRTRFIALIRAGAAAADILGTPFDPNVPEPFIRRELERPREHCRNICRYISTLTPQRILDAGCGTGGLTVALALAFPGAQIDAVDPLALNLEAAKLRADAYGISPTFQAIEANTALPFPEASFDLVACTSVLEFITVAGERRRLARELVRVSRGHIVITTPNPLARLREQHYGMWFGDLRRREDATWASRRGELIEMFRPFRPLPIPDRVRDKLGMPRLPDMAAGLLEHVLPWQLIVFASPAHVAKAS
jgi:SAM-dependent methyltransferase